LALNLICEGEADWIGNGRNRSDFLIDLHSAGQGPCQRIKMFTFNHIFVCLSMVNPNCISDEARWVFMLLLIHCVEGGFVGIDFIPSITEIHRTSSITRDPEFSLLLIATLGFNMMFCEEKPQDLKGIAAIRTKPKKIALDRSENIPAFRPPAFQISTAR
jgi:hypothetical protein